MAYGPNRLDVLRADNLSDIGTPNVLDGLVIVDDTDGELKTSTIDDLMVILPKGTAASPAIRASAYNDTGIYYGDGFGIPFIGVSGGGTVNMRFGSTATFIDKTVQVGGQKFVSTSGNFTTDAWNFLLMGA